MSQRYRNDGWATESEKLILSKLPSTGAALRVSEVMQRTGLPYADVKFSLETLLLARAVAKQGLMYRLNIVKGLS